MFKPSGTYLRVLLLTATRVALQTASPLLIVGYTCILPQIHLKHKRLHADLIRGYQKSLPHSAQRLEQELPCLKWQCSCC